MNDIIFNRWEEGLIKLHDQLIRLELYMMIHIMMILHLKHMLLYILLSTLIVFDVCAPSMNKIAQGLWWYNDYMMLLFIIWITWKNLVAQHPFIGIFCTYFIDKNYTVLFFNYINYYISYKHKYSNSQYLYLSFIIILRLKSLLQDLKTCINDLYSPNVFRY